MENDAIGLIKTSAKEPKGQCRIKEDELGLMALRTGLDGAKCPSGREVEQGRGNAINGHWCLRVEAFPCGIRTRCYYGTSFRIKAAPQFPEVGLDATEFGRKVIGGEEVAGHLPIVPLGSGAAVSEAQTRQKAC